MDNGVLTDKAYWGAIWRGQRDLPPAFDPADQSLYNTVNLRLHEVFTTYMKDMAEEALAVEAGCAQSQFLPYFSRHFGVRVAGIDYEEEGCARARAMLLRDGVAGDVMCADLFDAPLSLHGAADMLFSCGLVEHFQDTAGVVRAAGKLLKPGGVIITLIPNMTGMVGWLQKIMDPGVYGIHVPLRVQELREAHEAAGLKVLRAEYFMSINNNVVNTQRIRNRFWHQFVRRLLSLTTKPFWLWERTGMRLPSSRLFSPYVLVVARKADA